MKQITIESVKKITGAESAPVIFYLIFYSNSINISSTSIIDPSFT